MNKYLKYFLVTVSCGAVFFFLGEPFRNFLKLTEITEVRPTSAFPLVFGIAFGFCGTLGCAIGNLIADLINGYTANIFIPGFILQILYGYLPVLLFNHLRRNDKNKFQLDRIYKVIQFILISLVDSAFCAFYLWTLMHIVFGSPIFDLGFLNTFLNQIIFFIVIGIPSLCVFSIVKQKKENKKLGNKNYIFFSLNEKLILFFLGASIVISIFASIAAYYIFLPKYREDPISLWSFVYLVCGLSLFICLLPSIIFLYYMEVSVSKPIERLSSTAKDFGKESNIHLEIAKILMKCKKYLYFSSEIGDLARSYNSMANELGTYVDNLAAATKENEKIATQLNIATAIQLGALPKPHVFEGIDLFSTMKPALEVGGDFYDFFMIDDTHLAMVTADVSGKGVPAALFMMQSMIVIRSNLKQTCNPATALINANNDICSSNPMEMFVTVFACILDLKTNILTFANAGHEKPAICKKDGDFELLKTKNGFVVGGYPGFKYVNETLQLSQGDIFFTYTDGIPEAINEKNEGFGNERLVFSLNKYKTENLENLCNGMYESLEKYAGNAPQFDDVTMMAIKIK